MRAKHFWPLTIAVCAAGCTVDEVDFSGKTCPCDDGYVCDQSQDRCFLASGDAGPAGAAGKSGSGGSGGSGGTGGSSGLDGGAGLAGSGGTGNCASTEKLCGTCVSKSNPFFGCSADNCDPCPTPANGNAACSLGSCTLGSCNLGWDDCNGNVDDGCEFQANDDLNCGACNRTCALANALSTSCQSGACAPVCNTGFLDCSTPSASNPDDGCETNPTNNDQSCGTCSNSCSSQGASGGFKCIGASCGCTTTSQCILSAGLAASCNTTTGNCVCGGITCKPGEACNKVQGDSRCRCNSGAACATSEGCCPGSGCKNLSNDPDNCGICGRQCAGTQTCSAGSCV